MKRPLLMLTALTLLFGAQSLRVLLPSLAFYGREVLALSAGQVVVISYAPLALAWLAPLLGQRLGLGRTLRAFGVGLLICCLIEQFSTTPAINLWAACGGLAGFMGLLPLLYARARAESEAGLPALALGLLLGLSLDTALRGAAGTLDLSWIPSAWSRLIIVGLAGGFALVLWRVGSSPARLAGEPLRTSLPLIGLGPLLSVEWQVFKIRAGCRRSRAGRPRWRSRGLCWRTWVRSPRRPWYWGMRGRAARGWLACQAAC
jgi:hypothetical protein